MKTRKESFFGLHFDFHGTPKDGLQGRNLKEEDIRAICRELHPDFIQIDCKGHPGWASYPSEIGNALPEFALDTLALWRRVTREEGVALYMHYSGVYDIKYCTEHPEENCIYPDGSYHHGCTRTNGKYVDDLLIPQLSELTEKYGVDGFWVDGECWRTGCDFRPESLRAFERATGINLEGEVPAHRGDPYFEEYREYHRDLFRSYLNHYVDVLHSRFPSLQIASNWAFSDHMPEKVCANVDYLSGDLNPANGLVSARYAARALAQQGLPWDLMSWNFRIRVGSRAACVAKHPIQILQEAAAVIAMGGAYQNYVTQYRDGSPRMEQIRNLKPLADFVHERKDYCFRGEPIHQVAVLLSTYDRARESDGLFSRNGYEKIMGLTTLLCDAGQMTEIVCEHTLTKQIDAYPVIVVPELFDGLAPKTVTMLLDYAKRGGHLVLIGRNTLGVFAKAGAPFALEEREEYYPIGIAAYDNGQIKSGRAEPKPYCFEVDGGLGRGALFAPIAVKAQDCQTVGIFFEEGSDDVDSLALTVALDKGSISAIGFDIGSQYLEGSQYLHRILMRQMVGSLYEPIVRIERANGNLEMVLLRKDGRMMIQLVNGNGSHGDSSSVTDDRIPPVIDIEMSAEVEIMPDRILLQPQGRELSYTVEAGSDGRCARIRFAVDRVDIHSIVVFEEGKCI